ncbi:MAG: 2Fe-2S iron-sulfur cluster binding domain-containing protein [Candidatus Cloacimonetes bacterium]|nr:2Fe-2S iron-sulfur cluster binding domain-containing protein [Candidatus Cloacimonadota bacterium]
MQDIGITSLVSGGLALILVIAQRYLNDYGDCKIDINGKRLITLKGGSSLLNALSENQIFIPSACGGKGSCGTCKCQVLEGGGPLLPTEKPLLTTKEMTGNVRLACQIKVKSDVRIHIPESIFNIRRFQGVVSKIEDYTYDIKGVIITLTEPETIDFKAGQYVQLETPIYAKVRQKVGRAYSISSDPGNDRQIQLIIRYVPEGICTTWVHQYLNEGDQISFTGPYGDFFIRDTSADMIFVAGGSGKAPIKSILEYLSRVGTTRRMRYLFGARTCKDLYLTGEMHAFEQVFDDFEYIPVLSKPCPEENWQGRIGYVMPVFPELITDPANTEAYLCGSPAMIESVKKALIELGVPKDRIYYDSFG